MKYSKILRDERVTIKEMSMIDTNFSLLIQNLKKIYKKINETLNCQLKKVKLIIKDKILSEIRKYKKDPNKWRFKGRTYDSFC